MKFFFAALTLTFSLSTFAQEDLTFEKSFELLDERETLELAQKLETEEINKQMGGPQVIQMLRDLVALGNEAYDLVQKGKPTVSTSFAPISVLPRLRDGRYVSPMDLEGASGMKGLRLTVIGKSLVGFEVLRFTYTLVFQTARYGKGKYVMNAIASANTMARYGNSFDAKMELVGISNKGSSVAPVASAMIKLTYRGSSLLVVDESQDIIMIDGTGRASTIAR